jgi:anti-sigma regulatory factor (Ser/Thr protein kinase)
VGTGDLSIKVDADAENIALVREAVGKRARELGANRAVVDDLRTVVSEACNNVVLHAYPEDVPRRPLEVHLSAREGDLQLIVRDEGEGIQAPSGERPFGMRMGLLLVGAISSCFHLRSRRGKGTELLLRVPLQTKREELGQQG